MTLSTSVPTVSASSSFYIVLHDVTPVFARQVFEIADRFNGLVDTRIAAAFVPRWHGRALQRGDEQFASEVKERFGEVLLHGYTHRREQGRGLASLITGSSDEFNGLSVSATHERLAVGQEEFAEMFGSPAEGFIAPTFQRGHATPALLAEHGMQFSVGFGKLRIAGREALRLATWCWDLSPWRPAGYLGHGLGHMLMKTRPSALPCLALHPVDLDRRFIKRAVQLTKRLLDEGRRPILGGDLLLSRTPHESDASAC